MHPESFQQSDFYVSTDRSLLNFNFIYSHLSVESYWAKNMPKHKLVSAIDNSICFGVYINKNQVGFARVITDKAPFTYVCDVFVEEKYRGIGLSKKLMAFIIAFPDLQKLRRWILATANAHKLYNQYGFKALDKPENWIEVLMPYSCC